jgi:hypothetical protein
MPYLSYRSVWIRFYAPSGPGSGIRGETVPDRALGAALGAVAGGGGDIDGEQLVTMAIAPPSCPASG